MIMDPIIRNVVYYGVFNKTVIFHTAETAYAARVISKYYAGPEYEGTAFIAYTFLGILDNKEDIIKTSKELGVDVKKIIYWNFEHTLVYHDYRNRLIDAWEDIQPDEIWEWKADIFLKNPYDVDIPIKFMPLRYVESEPLEFKDPKYEFLFVGSDSPRRNGLMGAFTWFRTPFKWVNGYAINNIKDELVSCKSVLDIRLHDFTSVACLRLSEMICMNMPVIAEKDALQYYPNLIMYYDYDEIISKYNTVMTEPGNGDAYNYKLLSDHILNVIDSQYMNYRTVAERYKRLTEKNEDFETYKNKIIMEEKEK